MRPTEVFPAVRVIPSLQYFFFNSSQKCQVPMGNGSETKMCYLCKCQQLRLSVLHVKMMDSTVL